MVFGRKLRIVAAMDEIATATKHGEAFGKSAPYRGLFSEFVRGLSWLYLKATGWHIGTDWPVHVPKSVIVAAPHTSNWDFPLLLLLRAAAGRRVSSLAKHTLQEGAYVTAQTNFARLVAFRPDIEWKIGLASTNLGVTDGLAIEVFLVAEVVIHRRDIGIGAFADVPNARGIEAHFGKDFACGFQ